jgi:deoxyribonuclease-4
MNMETVRFGPSGNDALFYEQGHKSSLAAPAWLADMGLGAFEVNFGRGIRMTDKTATELGREAKKHNIKLSVHAPYFINLASSDSKILTNSYSYIERSLQLLLLMGGTNLVIHVASQGDLSREEAITRTKANLLDVLKKLDARGFADKNFRLCIETMGRLKSIGTHQEVCDICKIDKRVIPALDFGHINCVLQGELTNKPIRCAEIIDYCIAEIGLEKMQNVHIHFSAIIYGEKGEKTHTVLDNARWSIPFAPLASRIKQLNLTPTVICESREIMAQDAVKLMTQFNLV